MAVQVAELQAVLAFDQTRQIELGSAAIDPKRMAVTYFSSCDQILQDFSIFLMERPETQDFSNHCQIIVNFQVIMQTRIYSSF